VVSLRWQNLWQAPYCSRLISSWNVFSNKVAYKFLSFIHVLHHFIYQSNSNYMSCCQVNPSDVIIMEGILLFHDSRVRDLMNMKIFVDTGTNICVLNWWYLLVSPMPCNLQLWLMSREFSFRSCFTCRQCQYIIIFYCARICASLFHLNQKYTIYWYY
jgi:hypothetical protein